MHSGFGNEHATEAVAGALPQGQNNPQECPFQLYAEQLSGTAFTAARAANLRSWLYRLRPSVDHHTFAPLETRNYVAASEYGEATTEAIPRIVCSFAELKCNPNQMRWNPLPIPESGTPTDFLDGIVTICGSGDAAEKKGCAIHVWAANASMQRSFYNADGDLLMVPQEGAIKVRTELGLLAVAPGEIVVVPRGIVFQVALESQASRGYILETFKGHFQLPDLGPIGANGLANPRDFKYPVAAFDAPGVPSDTAVGHVVAVKMGGVLFSRELTRSPYDVVAWHGNYAPYKYALANFCTINTVSFDHPDPSIFTVLTCPSDTPGEAAADFVIFPPRSVVAERTFRPPYFHRNCMSEFMGMVRGSYDAKKGFVAGGSSLHPCMSAHGPDVATFGAAAVGELVPVKFDAGLAFMFETSVMLKPTQAAMSARWRDREYKKCWEGFRVSTHPALQI